MKLHRNKHHEAELHPHRTPHRHVRFAPHAPHSDARRTRKPRVHLRKTANEASQPSGRPSRPSPRPSSTTTRTTAQLHLHLSAASSGGDPKSGPPTALAAQILPADLATGQKAGYTFAITNCDKTTINNEDRFNSFEVTGVPQSVGHTGDRGFCADESTTRYDPAGGVNCTQSIK